jgi:hypothetical protein
MTITPQQRIAIIVFCLLGIPIVTTIVGVILNDGSGLSVIFGFLGGLEATVASAILGPFVGIFIKDDRRLISLVGYIAPSVVVLAYTVVAIIRN